MNRRPLVIIESPCAGDVKGNTTFARCCLHDSIMRGESPFASHLLYTQEYVLDDKVDRERKLGLETAARFYDAADLVAVYLDRGISNGMRLGIYRAHERGLRIEYRWLNGPLVMPDGMLCGGADQVLA